MRDDGARVFLKVVRRQMAILGGDKGFKITPGSARNQAQGFGIFRGECGVGLGGGRLTDAKGDPGGCKPNHGKR